MITAAAPAALPRVHTGRKPVRLWLWAPLTPLFLLLAPFALVLFPFLWLWLPQGRRPARPFASTLALGGVLLALGGTVVRVETRDVRLHIRIF